MSSVKIRPYEPRDATAFKALNTAWIERYFTLEPKDLALISDPQSHILDKGGRIIMAEDASLGPCGCVALIPMSKTRVELAKMAVDNRLQGRGIGGSILARATKEARDMGASEIWLESNSKLGAALHLYRKYGFNDLEPDQQVSSPYSRCNIQMVKSI